MEIKQLFIYPIKGLAGISIPSANVLKEGFENDRRWMLVDDKNNFISQRTDSRLALFETVIKEDVITIKYNGSKISFSLSANEKKSFKVKVWDDEVNALEVSSEVSKWFSTHLEREVKLIKKTPSAIRIKKLIKGPEQTNVSFADGYPYLIIGTQSLDSLNEKLEDKININRFRANIIVKTTVPHAEDNWDKISIGDVVLEIIKPCARCQVINIDQSSAGKSKEPLKTLSTYRSLENKIYFGANSIALKNGVIRVGDLISKL